MSDESRFELSGDLEFEHVGTMACTGHLLICDVEYFPPRFASAGQAKVSLGVELEVMPGTWQVLVAYEPGRPTPSEPGRPTPSEPGRPTPRFVLLTHDSELETETPLDQAEAVAVLRVDSGRITAIDPDLRDDLDMQTALLEAPREQVPCMLRPLDADPDAEPSGTLIDIDAGGVFELYAGLGLPRTTLFLAI